MGAYWALKVWLVQLRSWFIILLNFNEFKLKFELPQVVQATVLVSMQDSK